MLLLTQSLVFCNQVGEVEEGVETALKDSLGRITVEVWVEFNLSVKYEQNFFQEKQVMHKVTELLGCISCNNPA